GSRIKIHAPDVTQQLGSADNDAGMFHQVREQGELFGCELDAPLPALRRFGAEVELQVSYLQQLGCATQLLTTTQQRLHPCNQFVKGKRFCQIVVSAPVQARDAVM